MNKINKIVLLGLICFFYLFGMVHSQAATTLVPSTNAVTGTPAPTSTKKDSGFPLWALAPIIGGSFAIMAGIAGAFFYFRRSGGSSSKYNYDEKKDKKKEEKKKEEKKEEKKKEEKKKEDSKKEDSESSEKSEKSEKRQNNYQVVCHHCKYPVVDTRYDHCFHCGYELKCKRCNYFYQVNNGLCQNNCERDNQLYNQNRNNNNQSCYKCKQEIHDPNCDYCVHCGRLVKCKKCNTFYQNQNGLCENNCDNQHNNQNHQLSCFSCKQEIHDLKTEYCHNCGRLVKCKRCDNFYQPPNGLCKNNCNRENDKYNNVKYYQHYLQSQEYQNEEQKQRQQNQNQNQNQNQYYQQQQHQNHYYFHNFCFNCKNNINDLNLNNCQQCGKNVKCKNCSLLIQGNTGMCRNNCVN